MSAADESKTAVVIVKRTELALSRSEPLARRGLQTLNDLDEAEQCLKDGVAYFGTDEFERSFRCFKRGVEKSPLHGELNWRIALMFREGYGIPVDEAKALFHTSVSAENGYEWGQLELARLYGTGTFVPKDESTAHFWTEQAAMQDNSWAEIALGVMYEMGVGVDQDTEIAKYWYLRAAAHGGHVWKSRLTTMQIAIVGLTVLNDSPFT
jgi:TPR repeat protein